MRALMALTLVALLAMACGGGASSPPVQVAPAVTATPAATAAPAGAPTAAPGAPATPKATGGYDYGY